MPAAALTLLLTGDVMTGRGIDQLMPSPVAPDLYEPCVRDARDYVRLAEAAHGAIARPVPPGYVWGDALATLALEQTALRIVNLETAVTARGSPWPLKGIHYRMHPAHVGCLRAAAIDACVLANNHVLDWDRVGLADTLASLHAAGIATAGAGESADRAAAPALLAASGRRVLLFAAACESSGVPGAWRATATRAGVALLPDLGPSARRAFARRIDAARQPDDVVIVSLHWGGNWGHAIAPEERDFARGLIDAGADVVHGHSSHHAKAFELHRGRLILYGCGDFINDYEGIGGHESWRGDLAPAYVVTLDADGGCARLLVRLFQSRRLRLQAASAADRRWWRDTLNRECAVFGSVYRLRDDGALVGTAGS